MVPFNPSSLKHAQNFERVVSALGHADAGPAFKTLVGLAKEVTGLEKTHYYPGALARIGSPEAVNQLMDICFDSKFDDRPVHGSFSLGHALTATIRKLPSAKKEFWARVEAGKQKPLAPIVAQILGEIIDGNDVLPLLRYCDPSGADPISQALEYRVGELAISRRSMNETNANEMEPSDLSRLRSELLRVYLKQETMGSFAAKLLGIIDRRRDIFGRPSSEPRHPDIDSGAPWPAAAAAAGAICIAVNTESIALGTECGAFGLTMTETENPTAEIEPAPPHIRTEEKAQTISDPKLRKKYERVVLYNLYFAELSQLKCAVKRYATPALLQQQFPDLQVWKLLDTRDAQDVANGDFYAGHFAWTLVKRLNGLKGNDDRTLKNYRRALRKAGISV